MKRYKYLLFILPLFLFYQNCGQTGDVSLEGHSEVAKNSVADTDNVAEPIPTPVSTPTIPAEVPIITPIPSPNPSSTPVTTVMPSSLIATATPEIVKEQGSTLVEVKYKNLTAINILCQDKTKTKKYLNTIATLEDTMEGLLNLPITGVLSDISCELEGLNANVANFMPIKATLHIQVDCQNRIKNQETGSCEDFKCLKMQTLTLNDLNRIPARTNEGICYTVKLMSGISNSASSLTSTRDVEVKSRNHDNGSSDPNRIKNPYIMNKFNGEVNILGERVVKLAGAANDSAHILVDNYILTGVYPVSNNESANELTKYYKIRGTTDSSILIEGKYGVLFRETLLPVISFGALGTSSVSPIDISTEITPNVPHNIDIRALDCGGSRELSDIYLLFQ